MIPAGGGNAINFPGHRRDEAEANLDDRGAPATLAAHSAF